jgi:hypothetical protein
MCLPFLHLFVWYDALLRGWCVAYVGDVRVDNVIKNQLELYYFVDLGPTTVESSRNRSVTLIQLLLTYSIQIFRLRKQALFYITWLMKLVTEFSLLQYVGDFFPEKI